jgi:hypothetical protein
MWSQVPSEVHVVEKLWRDSGLHVPQDLNSHSSVAYVLNQKAGSLCTQDQNIGVAPKRDEPEAASIHLKQAELCSGIDALDDVTLPRSVRVRAEFFCTDSLFRSQVGHHAYTCLLGLV